MVFQVFWKGIDETNIFCSETDGWTGAGRLGDNTTKRLFWVVIGGILLYAALDALAQVLPPHYSPIKDAESDLAVGPYGYVMAVNFINRGVLSLVFLYALSKAARAGGGFTPSGAERRFRTGLYIFGVWSVGAILLAFFPTDVPAAPVSWHGAVHLVVAALAFLGGAFGAIVMSSRFGNSQVLQGAKKTALPIAALAVVFLFIGFGTITGPIGGLTERLFLGLVLLWVAVVSLHLARAKAGAKAAGFEAQVV
jgi:hypothetical membrane protein